MHELLPYGLTQAIAQCHAHHMLPLCGANWLVQQVPADLTNVLHNLVDGSEGKIVVTQNREEEMNYGLTTGIIFIESDKKNALCLERVVCNAHPTYSAVVFGTVIPET